MMMLMRLMKTNGQETICRNFHFPSSDISCSSSQSPLSTIILLVLARQNIFQYGYVKPSQAPRPQPVGDPDFVKPQKINFDEIRNFHFLGT